MSDLVTQSPLQSVDLSKLDTATKEVLKSTVAKHTSDPELSYFLTIAQSAGLNPFNKEIWCYKRAKKDAAGNYNYENSDLIVMTGRDGYLKIAKRNPNFKKIISQPVYENDTFTCDPIAEVIEHRFSSKNRGQVIGAYAIILEKDGTKHFKYITTADYKDAFSPVWKTKEAAMSCKCAESVLCKQYGGIAGIVAEETMDYDDPRTSSAPKIEATTSALKDKLLSRINACKTIEEMNEAGKEVQIEMAKLFDTEKEEVIQAGIQKRKQLKPIETTIIETVTDDEFSDLLDGIKNHSTLEGLTDLERDVISKKTFNKSQKTNIDAALKNAKASLSKIS